VVEKRQNNRHLTPKNPHFPSKKRKKAAKNYSFFTAFYFTILAINGV
jgi:hypothetical protein